MKKISFLAGVAALVAAMTTVYAKDEKAATPAPAAKPAQPAQPAQPAKPADKAAPAAGAPAQPEMAKKPAEPAAAMPLPTPSPVVAEMAKGMNGTWKCEGKMMMGGTERKSVSTFKIKLSPDKFWIVGTMEEKKSKDNPMPMAFTMYRTFDGKKWHSIMVDNMGGYGVSTSDGPKDGKVTWDGKATFMGMTFGARDYEEMKSPKEAHMWGDMSMDGGKTWAPAYDVTCKK